MIKGHCEKIYNRNMKATIEKLLNCQNISDYFEGK